MEIKLTQEVVNVMLDMLHQVNSHQWRVYKKETQIITGFTPLELSIGKVFDIKPIVEDLQIPFRVILPNGAIQPMYYTFDFSAIEVYLRRPSLWWVDKQKRG